MPQHFYELVWLLALIPAYYLGMPLLILAKNRISARPNFKVLDLKQINPDIARFLMSRAEALFALGFEEPTLLKMPGAATNVNGYLIMVVNRKTGDKAMVTALIGTGPSPIQSLYVEFNTRFDSGAVFNTLNSAQLNAFTAMPMTIRTKVPGVNDLRVLYRLHRFVIEKHLPAGEPVVYAPGQEIEYLTTYAFRQPCDEMVRRGWLYYEANAECYRPTLKGAYLMTWGLMQPMKALRQAAMYQRARRVLAEFARARERDSIEG
jgi:hypothetical protein